MLWAFIGGVIFGFGLLAAMSAVLGGSLNISYEEQAAEDAAQAEFIRKYRTQARLKSSRLHIVK